MEIVVDEDELTRTDDEFGDYLYEGKLFSGIACEKDPRTGAIIGVFGYRDGKLHGPARTWYANGQMAEEEFNFGGAHHGPQHQWYPDGQLKSAGYIERGATVWRRAWNERGEMTESIEAEQLPGQIARIEEARRTGPKYRVTDIDLDKLEFVERPEGWRVSERS